MTKKSEKYYSELETQVLFSSNPTLSFQDVCTGMVLYKKFNIWQANFAIRKTMFSAPFNDVITAFKVAERFLNESKITRW